MSLEIGNDQLFAAKMVKAYSVWYVLLAFVFISSCKTVERFDDYSGKIPQRSLNEVLEALEKNQADYSFLEEKIQLRGETVYYEGSADLTLRIKKGEKMWASLRKIGIEGGRMMATPDSVFMINRLERYFVAGSVKSLQKVSGYEFSYHDLESLVTGSIPSAYLTMSKFRQEGSACILEINDRDALMTYTINAYNLLPEHIVLRDGVGGFAEVHYKSYQKMKGKFYPQWMEVSIKSPEITAKAILEIREITINAPKEMTFSIPSRYEEITW